jgi:hypothetical protein
MRARSLRISDDPVSSETAATRTGRLFCGRFVEWVTPPMRNCWHTANSKTRGLTEIDGPTWMPRRMAAKALRDTAVEQAAACFRMEIKRRIGQLIAAQREGRA